MKKLKERDKEEVKEWQKKERSYINCPCGWRVNWQTAVKSRKTILQLFFTATLKCKSSSVATCFLLCPNDCNSPAVKVLRDATAMRSGSGNVKSVCLSHTILMSPANRSSPFYLSLDVRTSLHAPDLFSHKPLTHLSTQQTDNLLQEWIMSLWKYRSTCAERSLLLMTMNL
jgi:hypothetical protein